MGWANHWFVVDTGADLASAPRALATQAGLEWEQLAPGGLRGVTGAPVAARLGRVRLRAGGVEFVVRCMFVDSDRVPLVLGRADFLDRFVLTFDQPGRRIILTPVL
jgi:hypothetical protein